MIAAKEKKKGLNLKEEQQQTLFRLLLFF